MPYVPPALNTRCNWWEPNNLQSNWASGAGFIPDPDFRPNIQIRPSAKLFIEVSHMNPSCMMEVILDKAFAGSPPRPSTAEYQYWCPVIECPIDSGRYYFVVGILDVAAHFANQYRLAYAVPTYGTDNYDTGDVHWPWVPPTTLPLAHVYNDPI